MNESNALCVTFMLLGLLIILQAQFMIGGANSSQVQTMY